MKPANMAIPSHCGRVSATGGKRTLVRRCSGSPVASLGPTVDRLSREGDDLHRQRAQVEPFRPGWPIAVLFLPCVADPAAFIRVEMSLDPPVHGVDVVPREQA